MTIKVKPLVWNDYAEIAGGPVRLSDGATVALRALTKVGTYWIHYDSFTGSYQARYDRDVVSPWTTIEDAKAAAQADYEARILSAIEAVDPATIRAEALRDMIAAKARKYAEHYPQSSDGRNTFLMFAEWVESLALIDKGELK